MKWELKTIDELGFVGRGKSKHRPRGDEKLYGGNYRFIQTGDIAGSEFYITSFSKTYSEFGLAQSKLWRKGTLCISIVGANTGESAILDFDACFPDSVIGFIPNLEKANTAFVKYYLDTAITYIKKISEGTARENLSLDKLLSIKILTPPVQVQNKITSVLKSYDNLIENNNRKIAILEEMAEEIYKEWFIRLRFPNWKETKVVDGIPEGWKICSLREVLDYQRGKSYRSEDLSKNEGLPFINLKCIQRGGGFRRNGIKFYKGKYKETDLVKNGDIVLAVTDMTQSRDLVGRVARVPKMDEYDEFMISMDLIKIIPKGISKLFLYSSLRYSHFGLQIKEFANGANVLHLNPELVKFQRITMPSKGLMEKFENIVLPMLEEIDILKIKNDNLQKTRDLLLPRLVNGKLSVEHLIESK